MRDLTRAHGDSREEILARLITDIDDTRESFGDEHADSRAAIL